MIQRPDQSEAPQYYFTYINKVPDGAIVDILETQLTDMAEMLRGISDRTSQHRYAGDKWSVRQVQSHVNDTERIFVFRALWIARALEGALPGFDQNAAILTAGAESRDWSSHVDEFVAVRTVSLLLFRQLPDAAWERRGIASGHEFTVRALAYITAGHVFHHAAGLRDNYLRPRNST